VPLLLATLVYGLMFIWHRGSTAVGRSLHEDLIPVPEFMRDIHAQHVARVPGSAVFITRAVKDVPPSWSGTSGRTAACIATAGADRRVRSGAARA